MKRFLSLFVLIICVFTLSSCKKEQSVTKQTFAFDTVINITVNEKDKALIDSAFKSCKNYEKIFSRTNSESELFKLNKKGNTSVSEDILEVLDFSLEMSRLTDGAFDVTVAPLVALWDIKERKEPPTPEEVENTLSFTGYESISLNPLNLSGKKIDLGAVAKGYVADKIAENFRSNGVESAVIDLGGNVILIGEYTVGIRDPFDPNEIFATIKVKDKSAVTSGAYQRYFEYDGKRYHHILDPRTGYPSDSGVASVTVISPSSMQADALSTSIFILGKDALSICDNFPDTDALIIMEDGSIVTTENFEKKYDLKK